MKMADELQTEIEFIRADYRRRLKAQAVLMAGELNHYAARYSTQDRAERLHLYHKLVEHIKTLDAKELERLMDNLRCWLLCVGMRVPSVAQLEGPARRQRERERWN